MKFLVIDFMRESGSAIALAIARGGDDVIYSPVVGRELSDTFAMSVLTGFDKIVVDPNWYSRIDEVDYIVVMDVEHGGHITKFLKGIGKKVIGPTPITAKAENSRHLGKKVMEKYGMAVPRNGSFKTADDLEAFIKKNPGRYVLKMDAKARCLLETFVASDPESVDLIEEAHAVQKAVDMFGGSFYVEEFIDGIEVSIGSWFDGKKFIQPMFVCFESMSGFVYLFDPVDNGKLFDLNKFAPFFAQEGMVGAVDLNCVYNPGEKTLYGLEWTIRFGAGVTELWMYLLDNAGRFFAGLADGNPTVNFRREVLDGDFSIGASFRVFRDAESADHMVAMSQNADDRIDTIVADEDVDKDLIFDAGDVSYWPSYPMKTKSGDFATIAVPGGLEIGAHIVAFGNSMADLVKKAEKMDGLVKFSSQSIRARELQKDASRGIQLMTSVLSGKNEDIEPLEIAWENRMVPWRKVL